MKKNTSLSYSAIAIATLFVSLFASKNAYSEISIEYFNQYKHTKEMKAYVDGLGKAYSWMNVRLNTDKKPQIYCPPKELAITGDNYFRLIEDSINQKNNNMGLIEPMLLDQLIKVFPCNKL
jgi:hypothetical protein